MSDLLLAAALLTGAVALAVVSGPPLPPAAPGSPPTVDASLHVVGERITTTRDGVLVVPVEVDNRGPEVAIERVVTSALPVRTTPVTAGATRVGRAGRARFVAIVEPDCALLRPGSGIAFVAVAEVHLQPGDAPGGELVVDIGADPAVAAAVRRRCLAVG